MRKSLSSALSANRTGLYYWGYFQRINRQKVKRRLFLLFITSMSFIKTQAATLRILPALDSLAVTNEKNANVVSQTAYPNPISDEGWLKISTKLPLKNASLKIYDASGMEMRAQVDVSPGSENENTVEFHINRGNLKRGIYFYFIIDEEKPVASGRLLVD